MNKNTIGSNLLTECLKLQIGFAACDAVTGLKLVERGVPKEKLALIAVPLVPLQIILPLVISKYTAGPRPMDVYLKAIPYRYTQISLEQLEII